MADSTRQNRFSSSVGRVILLVVGGVVFLYTTAFLISWLSQPKVERMAGFSEEELSVEGYGAAVPSPDTGEAGPDALYLQALSTLRTARSSTLGLFPTYDAEKLQRAGRLLERVVDRAEDDAFLEREASYMLGKVRLIQGRREPARQALRTVVRDGGRKAPEAARLLSELESG